MFSPYRSGRVDGKLRNFTLRLKLDNAVASLANLANHAERLVHFPHLQFHVRFALSSSLLDDILPLLANMLKLPAQAAGSAFLLERHGPTKTITLGTQTDEDATVLLKKIEEMGELAMVIEAMTLEL